MGFLFGLLTGIFAFVATVAIIVVHVLKINLDLPSPRNANVQNGAAAKRHESVRACNEELSHISEARLRQLIRKIIAETIGMPPLKNCQAISEVAVDRTSRTRRHRTEHYFQSKTYQDLLATAILNKIVEKQLNNNQDVRGEDTGEGDASNDNLSLPSFDQNYNVEKLSTSSGSSVEPGSDCSYPEMEQILNDNDDKYAELLRNSDREFVMSDYLANHMIPLPGLNATTDHYESEEDDYTSVTSSAVGDDTWERNWLFKKKKSTLSGSVANSSIGMLVPDPRENVRAQIGEKTADEVSDLSELGSDSDDSLKSLRSQLEPTNNRLINKHLIGGQNSKMILDELIERSSMISNTLPTEEEPHFYTDACNESIIDAATNNEAINNNVNKQQNSAEQTVEDSTSALRPPVVSGSLDSNTFTAIIFRNIHGISFKHGKGNN